MPSKTKGPNDPVSVVVAVKNTGNVALSNTKIRIQLRQDIPGVGSNMTFSDYQTVSLNVGEEKTLPAFTFGSGTLLPFSFNAYPVKVLVLYSVNGSAEQVYDSGWTISVTQTQVTKQITITSVSVT
jgi:hypothetical protein